MPHFKYLTHTSIFAPPSIDIPAKNYEDLR